MTAPQLHVLIVAAHPDDAEISLGGTILRLTDRGLKVGILDLTGGEMGTRGTQEDRAQEAASAGRLMGLTLRRNLALPDGRLRAGVSEREAVAHAICDYKPKILLGHYPDDPHPDHRGAGQLARDGWYLSGLQKLADKNGWGSAQRPAERYCFHSHAAFKPSLVVDISAVFERKLDVIRTYASQLAPSSAADNGGHLLKGNDILERVTHKARTYGEAIGVRYGEPLLCPGPLSADAHLLTLLAAAPPH